VEVGAYLVADAESFELVKPGEGPFDDPAGLAQAGTVDCALAGDLWCDASGPQEAAVLVVVVAAVGETAGPAGASGARGARGCGV
jgi:hypothetical protein